MLKNLSSLEATELDAWLAIVIMIATLTAIPLIDGDPFASWMLIPLVICTFAAARIIYARRGKKSPPIDWGDEKLVT
ncbi:hypothetical protein [Corynebacterium freiburgense]|uniref:hypothetical protein n=1 Tax=Corynebacterium freiburgense TaxID=556548 RepID=UPI00041D91A1|nr:hypothetical protein [Corynebacterium freiburgense]WJZ01774.1 hypothetical protein CFREI_02350 [Corynebacterium freiburgense]